MRPGPSQAGFALLLVLWATALLATLATQLTASGRGEALLARNLRDAATTEAAADGAIAQAVFHALDTTQAHWPADGTIRHLRLQGATIDLQLFNEAGKVNLNVAPPELLAALMHALGTDTATATTLSLAIADWRFPDAQRGPAAKDAPYRAAGRPYGPPGAPFQSLEELGLVVGMTPALLARLTPYLTLFHDGPPNVTAAPPVVRQALRESTGTADLQADPPEESVIAIAARATGPGGTTFVRRAVVKLGQRARGGLYQVLTWDAS